MRAAVVDIFTNIVTNTIVADASVDVPPDGSLFIDVTDVPCNIEWIYDPATGTFSDPNAPVEA